MSRGLTLTRFNVAFGEGVAVVRRAGSTSVIVCNVLGREISSAGAENVYLDRLVHGSRGSEDWGDFDASGAVSTILTRKLEAPS